ncbi:hypothetical protein SERLADRAFT_436717 [Serpula lacrymans var. lacrymans S7.9]|uniref:Major facilitator superfamily (MFS) profile domain-containing protein n=1 Tax=Serpula lacrymans var. lacrymans (strain S7.9) TaxID=578457 RepID=F8NS66_SERL9|nr:uncharacterized protein SERLADRAFT_436717 [Serpula lacrymans var. lacrymans S7.9]EGO26897.1 hypothetical protein SERLADRAFT_436717 [Serpula lacrymans var. lacrymans S7.9]
MEDIIKDDDGQMQGGPMDGAETDGTWHQEQARRLGISYKGRLRQLFSPLDSSLASAVHKDAECVEYTTKEERAVKRKIDNRVLTLVICRQVSHILRSHTSATYLVSLRYDSYIFNQFDRTNIGNAHVIDAFNENFGISDNNKWTVVLSIFYVGYCLLEIPANILQRRIGANRFFFLALTFWGVSSLSVVYAKGYASLLVLRHELAMRISLCMTGTFPGAISGLLAFGLVRARTSLLTGWQFLFLIEAVPTIAMAVVVLFFLPSYPFTASFLSPRERAISQARLSRDHKPQSHGGMTGWQGFKAILCDVNAWLFVLIYATFNVGVATMTYFLPTLINNLGFSAINAQGLTVAPYAVGWFMVVGQAWHSDHTHDRGYHVMLSTLISFIGYVILATCVQKSVGAAYFALFLVTGGNFSLFPLVMSWAANVFSPTSKRGVGTAFIVSISNCVSIASPQIYFDVNDDYRKGHAISAGCLFASFLAAFILRTRLSYMNKKRRKELESLGKEENEQDDSAEVWDNDLRYVFMT